MTSCLIVSIITACWIKGVHLSKEKQVFQTPADLFMKPKGQVNVSLTHNISSYYTILWYQRSAGDNSIKLIGYVSYETPNIEPSFPKRFSVSGNGEKTAYLHIQNLSHPEDSGEYFGAASMRTGNNYPAYFGQGTKVTVLEHDVKEPTVEVFRPSSKQCLHLKSEEKEKTLLCVASEFYPDHVSVSWKSDGVTVTAGVATDSFAARDGEYYKISSRLRVKAEDWYGQEYECIVTFFNGTNYNIHTENIRGEKAPKDFHIREKYLRATQTAKLSYAVFIIKSSIYGAFVAFLVWKLKGSSGK